jgi:hypothetical protein
MLNRLFVPDTIRYMYAGYAVLTVVLSTYLLSIYFRWKKTVKEYQDFKDND